MQDTSELADYASRENAFVEAFAGGDAAVTLLALVLIAAVVYFVWSHHQQHHT